MILLLFPLGCQGGGFGCTQDDYMGTRLLSALFPYLHVRQTIRGSSSELAFYRDRTPSQAQPGTEEILAQNRIKKVQRSKFIHCKEIVAVVSKSACSRGIF